MRIILNKTHGRFLDERIKDLSFTFSNFNFFVKVLRLECAIVRIMLSTTCEEIIVFSSVYFTFSKAKNKIIFTKKSSFYFDSWSEWIWKIASYF